MRICSIPALMMVLLPLGARANGILPPPSPDQELAVSVANVPMVLQLHETAQNGQSDLLGLAGGPTPGGFIGIWTVGLDQGTASVNQAATSATMRATLAAGASLKPGF